MSGRRQEYRKRARVGASEDGATFRATCPAFALEAGISTEQTSATEEESEAEHSSTQAGVASITQSTHFPLKDKNGCPSRPCRFGNACYRQNSSHLLEFSHSRANLRTKLSKLEPKTPRGPLFRLLSAFGFECGGCVSYDDLIGLMNEKLTNLETYCDLVECEQYANILPMFVFGFSSDVWTLLFGLYK